MGKRYQAVDTVHKPVWANTLTRSRQCVARILYPLDNWEKSRHIIQGKVELY